MKTLHMILISLVFGMGQGTVVAHAAEVKLTASDAAKADYFGRFVSISGNYAIVGADWNAEGGPNSGAAYIFVRDGETWNQQAKLMANDAAESNYFGTSVSISGEIAIVGASGDDEVGPNSGAAYIFVWDGTTWSQQAKLMATDAAESDYFGESVSMSGETAIVGTRYKDDSGYNSGAAYIFVRDGITWNQQAKLITNDLAEDDHFGHSVSMSGETAIVGSRYDDDAGSDSGSAYIFVRSGGTWIQQAKLVASDAAAGDHFGESVCISGETAIVGAYGDDDGGPGSGSAYIFVREGTNWKEHVKLTAGDPAYHDRFGCSVSINGDYIIIGAYGDHHIGVNSGAAYSFLRRGSSWIQKAKIVASDAAAGDYFGQSVSISGDYSIVGAYGNDGQSGSAYIYHSIDDLSLTAVTSPTEVMPRPDEYALQRSYPNPFNPITTIRYQLPEPGDVKLTIYDLLGQEVRVVVSERQPAGWYRVRWDGRNEAGQLVSSGVYLYRLDVEEEFLQTRKLTVVR